MVLRFLSGRKDAIKLRAAYAATSLHGVLTIFHGNLVRIFHLSLLFALDAISCIGHDISSFLFVENAEA